MKTTKNDILSALTDLERKLAALRTRVALMPDLTPDTFNIYEKVLIAWAIRIWSLDVTLTQMDMGLFLKNLPMVTEWDTEKPL